MGSAQFEESSPSAEASALGSVASSCIGEALADAAADGAVAVAVSEEPPELLLQPASPRVPTVRTVTAADTSLMFILLPLCVLIRRR
jgi:hypothetical protein